MAKQKVYLLVEYMEVAQPALTLSFIAKQKKNLTILHKEHIDLAEYQVQDGNLMDQKVLADKIKSLAEEKEFRLKHGVHFVVHSPRILNYNVILPKMNSNKAKNMAEKELEEVMIKHKEYYTRLIRTINAKEKGVMVYFDIFPRDLLNSLKELTDQMDISFESVTKGCYGLYAYYNTLKIEQDDAFIVYGNGHFVIVALILNRQFIEALTIFEPLNDEGASFEKVTKVIRLLAGKHQFAFEKRKVEHYVVLTTNLALKEKLCAYLVDHLKVETIHIEDMSFDLIMPSILIDGQQAEFTFDTKD